MMYDVQPEVSYVGYPLIDHSSTVYHIIKETKKRLHLQYNMKLHCDRPNLSILKDKRGAFLTQIAIAIGCWSTVKKHIIVSIQNETNIRSLFQGHI